MSLGVRGLWIRSLGGAYVCLGDRELGDVELVGGAMAGEE